MVSEDYTRDKTSPLLFLNLGETREAIKANKMGRAKQTMELIRDERSRNTTLRKRKEGLKKKVCELKVLCDIEVCLIIYGSPNNTNGRATELEIWPPNPDSVQRLINSYKDQSSEDRTRRSDTLSNFFEKRRQNMENDLLKLQKKNEMAMDKYSTWDERYDDLSNEQLRELENVLGAKLEDVKCRIEIVKGNQNLAISNVNDFMQQQPFYPLNPSEIEFPVNYSFNQIQQGGGGIQIDANFMQSPVMVQLDHTNYCTQLGGIFTSNFPGNSLERGFFTDPTHSHFSTPMGYCGSDTQIVLPYLHYMKTENAPEAQNQIMKKQN